ncbi:fumarylacetoacetate hydrolase family protein [Nocardioides sp.]|uniref:2-keto-4-pentenoate hydratase n=1 Tax=Nocardioides sp. TaxID=35761 RepID=UPI0025FBC72F|nr:fumarylacetoacetate hydrolase family protein [Nocardioides sp.]
MDLTTRPEALVVAAADRLWAAARSGVPCAPVRDLIGPDDLDRAYAVQEILISRALESGDTVVGRKIGATSTAVQQQLGVDQPDFGVLLAGMDVSTAPLVPTARLLQPKVEAEIAFILGEDLTDGPFDADRVRKCVSYAVAAVEIVDSRISGWDISFADTVADNASSGLFVLGTTRRALAEVDPVTVEMQMRVNGVVVSTGTGAACLGDPLTALAWLAEQAHRYGEPLRAGQVVLSGALGPMFAVGPGDHVEVQLSGFDPITLVFDQQEGP